MTLWVSKCLPLRVMGAALLLTCVSLAPGGVVSQGPLTGRQFSASLLRESSPVLADDLTGLLSGWIWSGFGFVSPAGAQTLQFQLPVQTDDRKVTLRWNRVPGDTLTTDERLADPSRKFGGYQIWRSSFESPGNFQLFRTYSLIDTTLHFAGNAGIFVDSDSILVRGCTGVPLPGEPFTCDPITGKAIAPFNGFFYYYAVTWFESKGDTVGGSVRWSHFDMQTPIQGRLADPVQPSPRVVAEGPLLGKVGVVPNPFNPRDPANRQQFGIESRVSFVNLPSPATVRIYTAAGDLVKIIENRDSNGAEDWDLKNGNGEDVVGGIYLYQVEASGGTLSKTGHFVIIR